MPDKDWKRLSLELATSAPLLINWWFTLTLFPQDLKLRRLSIQWGIVSLGFLFLFIALWFLGGLPYVGGYLSYATYFVGIVAPLGYLGLSAYAMREIWRGNEPRLKWTAVYVEKFTGDNVS